MNNQTSTGKINMPVYDLTCFWTDTITGLYFSLFSRNPDSRFKKEDISLFIRCYLCSGWIKPDQQFSGLFQNLSKSVLNSIDTMQENHDGS